MDPRGRDKIDERSVVETPEDVAVLYSWANLHGAKYRDFSASRREYRAQLRHRAAEHEREQALQAQAEAEAAARAAEETARKAVDVATAKPGVIDSGARRALREAEEAARMAAAERVEAERRAAAAAMAEVVARREEREIAEAHASAERQAARYAESEIRRRQLLGQKPPEVPGQMSDPYTPQPQVQSFTTTVSPSSAIHPQEMEPQTQLPSPELAGSQKPSLPRGGQRAEQSPEPERRHTQPVAEVVTGPISSAQILQGSAPMLSQGSGSTLSQQISQRRPQGYHPDEASGVREIYRGPEHEAQRKDNGSGSQARHTISSMQAAATTSAEAQRPSGEQPVYGGKRHTDPQPAFQEAPPLGRIRQVPTESLAASSARPEGWKTASGGRAVPSPVEFEADSYPGRELQSSLSGSRPIFGYAAAGYAVEQGNDRYAPPFQAPLHTDSARGRRAQDNFPYQYQSAGNYSDPPRRISPEAEQEPLRASGTRAAYNADPAGPAWLYAPPPTPELPQKSFLAPPPVQSSVAETLQHSRERVAARWYALKGVFEQPGQDVVEAAPVRQKEIRTPVLAVFSLAGGVGKTSMVATIGRSLSSLGEKVLLTDTTSHGLLPFYFGASELRRGTVRTFSPPSGSTDAPIYLVSYNVDEVGRDEEAQQSLTEEILNASRGTHRILLDLSMNSGWIVRQVARMNPTVLVPLAPDMNSVISVQAIEKFFHATSDGDGRPMAPYYVLNQFDASLPLHLDVREVLRRQLGERLLPIVIRQAPIVSEALAEGMTVVDYSPDAGVSADYMAVATWLRTLAAPAAAGFRNVRWSER
jgi:cellulose synthase operon protein YhjQ